MARSVENVEKRRLTSRQARFLAEESGLEPDKLKGITVGEALKELQFLVDSRLLTHRKICGRVVRENPATGEMEPVPHATVHVEDTDCRFLGFFPVEDPLWWWGWLVSCHRETLATVTTDECGRFCVLIPRWDIDYVLKLRQRWVCPPVRPWLRDLVDRLPDGPIPDPTIKPPIVIDPPIVRRPVPPLQPVQPFSPRRAEAEAGAQAATEMALGPLLGPNAPRLDGPADIVLSQVGPDRLRQPIHTGPVAAPLNQQARDRAYELHGDEALQALRSRPIGPFLRCYRTVTFEWSPIIDIPDISFRVTQDVDGDGDEETIYAEGHFEVRWDDDSHDDIELVASANARSTPACGLEPVTCQDVPAILAVGRMPLLEPGDTPAFHDHGSGYAVRPNRPRVGAVEAGPRIEPGAAPYARDLQLVGCVHVDGAAHYRVVYDYGDANDLIFDETWVSAADPGSTPTGYVTMSPDANGWYAIADLEKQLEDHWLLNWRTARYANGRYDVKLEIGDAGKSKIHESAVVPFEVDNARPAVGFTGVTWSEDGSAAVNLLGLTCPTISRDDPDNDVIMKVTWTVTAEHFRDAEISGFGCGAGSAMVQAPAAGDVYERWHDSVGETGGVWEATFRIPGGAVPGAYGFNIGGQGRGFSPAGSGGPGDDWIFDPVVNRATAQFRFAVIN